MKTIILYATKYGTTARIAQRIADRIDGAQVHDLKQRGIPDLKQFDCVIIGSSLYIGKIRKEARNFLANNSEAFSGKTLGLFLLGLEPEHTEAYFTNNFPENLLKNAKATAFLGGIYDPKRSGVLDKLLLKAVKKPEGHIDTISDKEIARFVEEITA